MCVCVCVCVCVAKPVAVELRCHATALIHSREKFSISFTTGCVEVKMCTKNIFWSTFQSSIIALINFQCVFIRDIAAVKHGTHGISANGGAFDIQLKPVIGKLIVLNNQSALIDR